MDCGYRLDFVVEKSLIIELKAVTESHPIHEAQVLTYLKLDKKSLGLLVNFNVPVLTKGIKRVVCGDLFKDEGGERGLVNRMLLFSVPPWLCGSNNSGLEDHKPQRHRDTEVGK